MADAAADGWTCPSCKSALTESYCGRCGEKRTESGDFTLAAIARLTFNAFSPVDGKVVRSFRELILRPGALTAALANGLRKPFLGPFQVFILANLLFFFVQSYSEMRVLTAGLDFRLYGPGGSEWARAMVADRLAATGRTLAAYEPVFDQAVAVNAKSLIGLMVLPFAALLPLIFFGRGRPLGVHIVFSVHFYAFVLLLLCLPLGFMIVLKLSGGPGVPSAFVDNVISIFLVVSCATYLFLSTKLVYGVGGLARAFQTAVLMAAVVCIFVGYKIVLLPITLYTT